MRKRKATRCKQYVCEFDMVEWATGKKWTKKYKGLPTRLCVEVLAVLWHHNIYNNYPELGITQYRLYNAKTKESWRLKKDPTPEELTQ
jgi:hypothetical protein